MAKKYKSIQYGPADLNDCGIGEPGAEAGDPSASSSGGSGHDNVKQFMREQNHHMSRLMEHLVVP